MGRALKSADRGLFRLTRIPTRVVGAGVGVPVDAVGTLGERVGWLRQTIEGPLLLSPSSLECRPSACPLFESVMRSPGLS